MVYRFTVEASVSRRAATRIEAIQPIFTGTSITTGAVPATVEINLTVFSLQNRHLCVMMCVYFST